MSRSRFFENKTVQKESLQDKALYYKFQVSGLLSKVVFQGSHWTTLCYTILRSTTVYYYVIHNDTLYWTVLICTPQCHSVLMQSIHLRSEVPERDKAFQHNRSKTQLFTSSCQFSASCAKLHVRSHATLLSATQYQRPTLCNTIPHCSTQYHLVLRSTTLHYKILIVLLCTILCYIILLRINVNI